MASLPPTTAGMTARIKPLLLQPKEEWLRIDAEPMTERGIFTNWVLPLAAIGPVAGLIGQQLFGFGAFGISYTPSLAFSLTMAVLGYVMSVIGVWVLARIVNALAPSFNGQKSSLQATKVAAFSWTAAWLAGIFGLIPALGILSILGLYSFYLLWIGLPLLMRVPEDKRTGYFVVTLLCAIVINFIVGAIASQIAFRVVPASTMGLGSLNGEIAVPGVGSIDVAKLEAATKQLERQAAATAAAAGATGAAAGAAGAVTAVQANVLADLLPASAAGFTRQSVESSAAAAAGVGGSTAKGVYVRGEDRITLSVTDMGGLGGLAALGGAFNLQSSKTTANGYEKISKVDGRMTTEEWDSSARRGKYATIVADRFMVEAEGDAASINVVKGLAASVDLGRVAALAK